VVPVGVSNKEVGVVVKVVSYIVLMGVRCIYLVVSAGDKDRQLFYVNDSMS